jgi:hypothetical protein
VCRVNSSQWIPRILLPIELQSCVANRRCVILPISRTRGFLTRSSYAVCLTLQSASLQRQGLAYILARQATSLLQRTKLNVTVICQAWHAKNARHMLLGNFGIYIFIPDGTHSLLADVIDYKEPTMLIVGSRGLGQIKG